MHRSEESTGIDSRSSIQTDCIIGNKRLIRGLFTGLFAYGGDDGIYEPSLYKNVNALHRPRSASSLVQQVTARTSAGHKFLARTAKPLLFFTQPRPQADIKTKLDTQISQVLQMGSNLLNRPVHASIKSSKWCNTMSGMSSTARLSRC